MKSFAAKRPFFVLLLPVFFVFHRWVENRNFVAFSDCLPLIGIYVAAAVALYGLFFLVLRNSGRAALISCYILAFYLFFGVFHDFFRTHSIVLHRYSILLPLFAVSVVVLALLLRKRTGFTRIMLFLNVLLVLYLLTDIAGLIGGRRGRIVAPVSSTLAGTQAACDTCAKPDIYLLLFDEYSGNNVLRDTLHYDNSGLHNFLREQGFRVLPESRANYYFTPFSMASILNGAYLTGIRQPLSLEPDDYLLAFDGIRRSEVVNFLLARGYRVLNYSPFDLPGHPFAMDQPFIPVKTRLITYPTFYNYFRRDLGAWLDNLLRGKLSPVESYANYTRRINDRFLKATIEESRHADIRPRFVYMHVMMPHLPYLYDSLQRPRPLSDIAQNMRTGNPAMYREYLPYTNARIREVIGAIRRNSGGKAVILFMSDHGFRYDPIEVYHDLFFYNQNAVYLPGGDTTGFYDSISGVNQFRVLLNKLFRVNMPLLPDSTLFLHDRPYGDGKDNEIKP